MYRGKVREEMGDADGAIADYQRALEIAPPSWSAGAAVADMITKARETTGR